MKISANKLLITGGASGIGKGLAERFLQEDNTVIICGRREEMLAAMKAQFPDLITRVCDLTNEADRIDLYHWIAAEHPDLNVLVNNAGIQNWMQVEAPDFYQRAKEEIVTNVEAPLHLTSLFLGLPSFNTLLNVTSGLSFVPYTRVPVYSATKAFFHSYTLSLQYLLRDRNVEVIELVPPALNTDLGGKGLHDTAPPVSAFIDAVFQQLQEGKRTITFGFSEAMANAGPAELQAVFDRLNPK